MLKVVAGGKRGAEVKVLEGKTFDIHKFLKINNQEEPARPISDFLNISDSSKRQLFAALLDRWMLFQQGEESIYVKHVASDRLNVMYQIILSGQPWDGIYELALKGKKIQVKGYIVNEKRILSVESKGNYNLAVFMGKNGCKYSISRMDYASDAEFKQALLNTGLITQEDLDIYYKPDDIVKPYLNRVLPQIVLK